MRAIYATVTAVVAGGIAGLALYQAGPFGLLFVGLVLSACCAVAGRLGPRGTEAALGLVANVAMNGTLVLCEWSYFEGIHRPDIFRDALPGLLRWFFFSAGVSLAVGLVLWSIRKDRSRAG